MGADGIRFIVFWNVFRYEDPFLWRDDRGFHMYGNFDHRGVNFN